MMTWSPMPPVTRTATMTFPGGVSVNRAGRDPRRLKAILRMVRDESHLREYFKSDQPVLSSRRCSLALCKARRVNSLMICQPPIPLTLFSRSLIRCWASTSWKRIR